MRRRCRAKRIQCHGPVPDSAGRACGCFRPGWLQALARQFQQAKARQFAHLHAGAVGFQRFAQAVSTSALVFRVFHVDEIDHDQPAQVAQRSRRAISSAASRLVFSAVFDVAALGGARRVDVHRHQRFGVVDDDGAAGRQGDAREGGFDLVFDLEAGEQRHVVCTALTRLTLPGMTWLMNWRAWAWISLGVDEDFANVGLEVIADGANHQAAFLEDQNGASWRRRRFQSRSTVATGGSNPIAALPASGQCRRCGRSGSCRPGFPTGPAARAARCALRLRCGATRRRHAGCWASAPDNGQPG